MDDAVYRKIGGKYKRVPEHERWLESRPVEGIWLVDKHGGQRVMCRVGELPDAVPLACLHLRKEAACSAVVNLKGKVSASDIVDAVFKAVVTPDAEKED